MDVNEELAHLIRVLLNPDDPVSKSREEKNDSLPFTEFIESDFRDVEFLTAHASMASELPEHTGPLLQFMLIIKRYWALWSNEEYFIERFGATEESRLINILVDSARHQLEPVIGAFSLIQLREGASRGDEWYMKYASFLEGAKAGSTFLLITDDEMSTRYGFPFDVCFQR